MGVVFKCGLVCVAGADARPDWRDVADRLALAREACGVNARYLGALRAEDGAWCVPFFSAESQDGRWGELRSAIGSYTPYAVSAERRIDPASATRETLSILRGLASGREDAPRAHDLRGEEPPVLERPEDAFEGLIGMREQSLTLQKLARALAKHGRSAVDCFHFIFEGNPGTGKTELARRLVSYLDLIGVTDGTRRMVKVGGNDLVAKYVGHAADKVKKVVESAAGGMLFIDEFYALSRDAGGFSREALDTLTEQLDAVRGEVVCVIAGYPEEIAETLSLNPGLRDRFGYRIEFPDYTDEELEQIFVSMARKRGFSVACREELGEAVGRLRRSTSFSNARSVRRLVDHAVVEASWDHDDPVIEEKDLSLALDQCLREPVRRLAGF